MNEDSAPPRKRARLNEEGMSKVNPSEDVSCGIDPETRLRRDGAELEEVRRRLADQLFEYFDRERKEKKEKKDRRDECGILDFWDIIALASRENVSLIDVKDAEGRTPLMMAIQTSKRDICQFLIRHGADVNAYTEKGNYPLVIAAQKGLLDISAMLLEAGACDKSKNTALIPASHFGYYEVLELLLNRGASANFVNSKGTNSLMRASQENRREVVELLLKSGSNPNASNAEGMTALMLAAQRGHTVIVSTLLQSGADVNMQTRQGSTALLLAAKRGHLEACRLLVAAGADIFRKDDRGKDARESAMKRRYTDVLKVLTTESQLELMRYDCRAKRSFQLAKFAVLFVQGRAKIMNRSRYSSSYCKALSSALVLPPPLLRIIASMIPLPQLWNVQLKHLSTRKEETPHKVTVDGMRIINDILNEVSLDFEQRDRRRERPGTTIKAMESKGKLIQLRDDSSFGFIFRQGGPMPMEPGLFIRLKEMANVQGTINILGPKGMTFSVTTANHVVALLNDLVCWHSKRK